MRSTNTLPILGFYFLALCFVSNSWAQIASTSILEDRNADSLVSVVAIGDSLTAGLGDSLPAGIEVLELNGSEYGEGYPGRLSRYLGVPVENEGIAGEFLTSGGADRVPSELQSSQADCAIIFEGLNDAFFRTSSADVGRAFQRIANVGHVFGRTIVLVTSPPPCCTRAGRDVFVEAYNAEIRRVASENNLIVADVARAWATTCQSKEACELFNVPEGLHPNKTGYDVIAQTIAAAILGIDIFAVDGAAKLASTTGLPLESIKVKPSRVMPLATKSRE
jgi:lysophospholipase L1-like esterase